MDDSDCPYILDVEIYYTYSKRRLTFVCSTSEMSVYANFMPNENQMIWMTKKCCKKGLEVIKSSRNYGLIKMW